jgi:hypothetical protein
MDIYLLAINNCLNEYETKIRANMSDVTRKVLANAYNLRRLFLETDDSDQVYHTYTFLMDVCGEDFRMGSDELINYLHNHPTKVPKFNLSMLDKGERRNFLYSADEIEFEDDALVLYNKLVRV